MLLIDLNSVSLFNWLNLDNCISVVMLNTVFRTILLRRKIHAGEKPGSAHIWYCIGLEHFWLGHVYSVLLQATILSNPFYKTLAMMKSYRSSQLILGSQPSMYYRVFFFSYRCTAENGIKMLSFSFVNITVC